MYNKNNGRIFQKYTHSVLNNRVQDILLPALSGISISFAFYSKKLSFLVFFALVPLMYSILYEFKMVKLIIYSLVLYSFSLIWAPNSVSMITDSPALRILVSAVMIVGISLILSGFLILPFQILRFKTYSELQTAFIFPFLYIFGEWLQGAFHPIAFPWLKLGNIASPFTLFIQSASVFGTLFISLLILYINMLPAILLIKIKASKKSLFAIGAFSLTTLNLLFGCYNIDSKNTQTAPTLSAIIVQGNYPKESKRASTPHETLEKYLKLIYSDKIEKADLILFPETSMHSTIYKTDNLQQMLYELCDKFNAILLSGSQYNADDKRYNACMAVTSDKKINAAYLKRILVPFGEYDPLKSDLFNLDSSGFSAGKECSLINSDKGSIGCSICFESLFSESVSECVKKGAGVITILTNDSWLGNKIPLYQHHSHSIMRAVENNRYVLTSTNTGISSIIDCHGRIISQSELNTECVISGTYYMKNDITFYTKYGDIIIIPSCIIIFCSSIIFVFRQISGLIFKKT